jgi:hypothetical protein
MTQYVDAEALLADVRRKQQRAEEVARRVRSKLGVGRPRSHLTDGLTAEEIERDTAWIYHIRTSGGAHREDDAVADHPSLRQDDRSEAVYVRRTRADRIRKQIFRDELKRMDNEGDYQEPEGEASMGTIWYGGKAGRGRIIV